MRPVAIMLLIGSLLSLAGESLIAQESARLSAGLEHQNQYDSLRAPGCDSLWDGALFGVLPGALAGFVWAGATAGEGVGGRSGPEVFVIAGAIGGVIGVLIDGATCNSSDDQDERRLSPPPADSNAPQDSTAVSRTDQELLRLPFVSSILKRGLQ